MSSTPTPTPEQMDALRRFRDRYGRSWRKILNDMWFNGEDAQEEDGHLLRQVRNQLGPRWLTTAKL